MSIKGQQSAEEQRRKTEERKEKLRVRGRQGSGVDTLRVRGRQGSGVDTLRVRGRQGSGVDTYCVLFIDGWVCDQKPDSQYLYMYIHVSDLYCASTSVRVWCTVSCRKRW